MKGRLLCAAFVVATLPVYPAVAASRAGIVMHVTWHRDGLLTWERVERRAIRTPNDAPPHHRPRSRPLEVIAVGRPGIVEVRVRYAQRDGGAVHRSVLSSHVVRARETAHRRRGHRRYAAFGFEAHGIARMAYIARSAIEMLATAYTADCAGCDGMTAIGRRAGYGIVAVDPRVIPLGTRLYIPGYGFAVAGDTGGAIVGHRIDLGFDSLRDAMLFGRRAIEVYRLK